MAGKVTIIATRRYILPLLTQRSSTHYFIFSHNQFLFDISNGKMKKGRLRRIILPNSFAHFLDISNANTLREMFENPAIFNPGKKRNFDLYIGSSAPLSNIFYLLLVLAPGMLVIYHEYQLHDADIKVSRVLPQASWIERQIKFMSKTDALITAARDPKIAFHEERTARPQNSSHHNDITTDGAGYEWGVCDKDCGWCGRCTLEY